MQILSNNNKTLKFRAWDPKNNEWIEPAYFVIDGCGRFFHEHLDHSEYKEDIIVMQFTGLLDRNGKEIYEGDIVRCMNSNGGTTDPVVVEYYPENGYYPLHDMELFDFEILGNIYETPELLK